MPQVKYIELNARITVGPSTDGSAVPNTVAIKKAKTALANVLPVSWTFEDCQESVAASRRIVTFSAYIEGM